MEFAMPFDGNGNHSLPPGTIVQEGQTVLPSQHNPPFLDVSSSLSQTLLRSGVAPWMGTQNANGNKLTNLAPPTNPNDAARLADIKSGLPKVTIYDTAGNHTHNFESGTTKFQIEGCGGGGAGAGTNNTSAGTGDTHYGHGGNSGWYYETSVLDRGAIVSASLTIGAGGTSTNSAGSETNGGDTTYNDGTNSFTWGGGFTPPALSAGNVGPQMYQYGQASAPPSAAALFGRGRFGTRGSIIWTGTGVVGSGYGGDTPYGRGGAPVDAGSNGNAGTGNGSGGSGSAKNSGGTTSYIGGAGRPGIIIIKEW